MRVKCIILGVVVILCIALILLGLFIDFRFVQQKEAVVQENQFYHDLLYDYVSMDSAHYEIQRTLLINLNDQQKRADSIEQVYLKNINKKLDNVLNATNNLKAMK